MSAPSPDRRRRWWQRLGWPGAIAVGVVVTTLLVPLVGLLRAEGGPMEEGFMLVFPERVLHGAVPNRDFLHLYGPGSLWVLAGAFKVFGVSLLTERFVALAQQSAVIAVVVTLSWPWGAPVAAAAGVTAVLLAVTPIGLVALPWMGGMAFALWGLVLALRGARRWHGGRATDAVRARREVMAGAALCGIGLLYRPDLILAVALGGAVVWWVLDRRLRRPLLGGLAIGLAPMLVHVAMAGPGHVVQGMLIDPVFRLRAGRSLPIPPSATDLDGFLQKIAELDVIHWPAPLNTPQQLRAWFFLLLAATVLLLVAGVIAVRRDRTCWRARRLLLAGAFCVGVLPQAFQRPDSTHLAWVTVVTFAMVPAAVAELLARRAGRWSGLAGIAVVTAMVFAVVPFFTVRRYTDFALQTFGHSRSAHEITHDGRTFYYGRRDVPVAFEKLAVDVDRLSKHGDRLFVGPIDLTRTPYVDSWIYYAFPDLVPATYYIEMDPGVADREGSGLDDDLRSADLVVLAGMWDTWTEPNASVDHGSTDAQRALGEHFCLEGTYDDLFQLYARCR